MAVYKVRKVKVPNDGLLLDCLFRFDFADAYCLPISDEQASDIDDLARAGFMHIPSWVVILMWFRNLLVRPLGLKASYDPTANSSTGPLEAGTHVGIFRVYARTCTEVLLGEDDKHLDFRVSVRVDGSTGERQVLVATVVCFNSCLGRLYLALVGPFHKVIVPAIISPQAKSCMMCISWIALKRPRRTSARSHPQPFPQRERG